MISVLIMGVNKCFDPGFFENGEIFLGRARQNSGVHSEAAEIDWATPLH